MSLPELLVDFSKLVVAFFIVLDPLGILPVLVSLSAAMSGSEFRRLAFKVVGSGLLLVLFFIVTGTWVLTLFAVSIEDLRIGGGLLLLIIAFRLVLEGHIGPKGEDGYRAAVVPLISPLLVGPGTITAAVVFARVNGVLLTAAAAFTALVISLAVFLSSKFIYRLIGDAGADLVARIMGVLITAIGISFIRKGILHIIG